MATSKSAANKNLNNFVKGGCSKKRVLNYSKKDCEYSVQEKFVVNLVVYWWDNVDRVVKM